MGLKASHSLSPQTELCQTLGKELYPKKAVIVPKVLLASRYGNINNFLFQLRVLPHTYVTYIIHGTYNHFQLSHTD